MIYHHFFDKFASRRSVSAGIIGAVRYVTAVITQAPRTGRLAVSIVADISAEAAKTACEKSGIDSERLVYRATLADAEQAIASGKLVYTDRCELVPRIRAVDVVCESTGFPEASARYALDSIENGKHVAMCTKDCDVSIGPILKKLATDRGVVFTPVDGDQHGLLIQLYEWAKTIGLTVTGGGKATDGEFIWDKERSTVTIKTDKTIRPPYCERVKFAERDRPYLGAIPPGRVEEYITRRQEMLATHYLRHGWRSLPNRPCGA